MGVSYVLNIVMRKSESNKSVFGDKPNYQKRTHFSTIDVRAKEYGNQEFVVPWQMSKANESKNMVK